MIGMNLNQYHITASIGAGGMGEVFRARDTRLNRDVAVKVLPKDFAADGDRQRRFEQEAKMLAALNHPNILTIHDAGLPSPRASVKPSHSPSLASLRLCVRPPRSTPHSSSPTRGGLSTRISIAG